MAYSDNVLSSFSITTGKQVEVIFKKRNRCKCRVYDVILLCSYFKANSISSVKSAVNKNNRKNLKNNSDVNNSSSTFMNGNQSDAHHKRYYDDGSEQIYKIFKEIGLVYNKEDIMYFINKLHAQNCTCNLAGYSPNRNRFSAKPCQQHLAVYQNYQQQQSLTRTTTGHHDTESGRHNLDQNRNKLLMKYWSMRHLLFNKFDHGILLDDESFFSVCPEVLSNHIALRCKNDVALDPFCGAGGGIIQLAKTCRKVIAIDIDPDKIALAKHNAKIYGVANKITFIVGDFFALAPHLKADVIFMSPPWGVPEHSLNDDCSFMSMCLGDHCGFTLFDVAKKIAPRIAFHLPKSSNIYECLWLAEDFGRVEIQQNIINGTLNSITAFFGDFVNLTNKDYQNYCN